MKSKITIWMLMLTTVFVVSVGGAYADAKIQENENYRFINVANDHAISIFTDDSTADLSYDYTTGFGELKTLEDNALNTQQFYFVKSGDSDYYLMSRAGDTMYLATVLSDENVAEGNKIVIEDGFIENKNRQRWEIVDVDGNHIALVSKSNPELAITYVGYDNQLRLMPYSGEKEQQFSFENEQDEKSRTSSRNSHIKLMSEDSLSNPETNDNVTYVDESQTEEDAEGNADVSDRMNNWFDEIESYISAYRGLDFDGYYGAQCVDLAYHYTHYLFHPNEGASSFRQSIDGGNGGEIYDRGNSEYYEKIQYYPGFVAQKGDLVIFQYNSARGWGHWGHVAVVESATTDALNVITQNGSAGHYVRRSTYDYSDYAAYNYTEIVGFLRPRADKIAQ